MRRCPSCILPDSAVVIENNGPCRLCRTDDGKLDYLGETALKELLNRHKALAAQNRSRYECMVSVSGGKDSIYALYKLVRDYNMKVLAFYYDHGFAEPTATENLKNAIRILGSDLVVNKDNTLQLNYLRRNFRLLLDQPAKYLGRLYHLLCVGCNTGYVAIADDIARQHGISLIMQGGCPVEGELRVYIKPRNYRTQYGKILSALRIELLEIMACPIFHNLRYRKNIASHAFYWYGLTNKLSQLGRGKSNVPERAHYFGYMPWNDIGVMEELKKELQWRQPPNRTVTMRFDCLMHVLRDRLSLIYSGISEKEINFSLMIRKGMLSRQEALDRAKKEIEEEEEMVGDVLSQILARIDALDLLPKARQIWKI